VFYVTAVFLLAIGIAAIWYVNTLNVVLQRIDLSHYQLDLVAEAQAGFHDGAAKTAYHLARIHDIEKRATTERERGLIADADAALNTLPPDSLRAAQIVDELSAYYRAVGVAGQQRLEVLHRRAVKLTIVVMADGVLLAVILLYLTRRWVVRPVIALEAAAGQLVAAPSASGEKDEVTALARHLKALGPTVIDLRARVENAERLAKIGESTSFVAQNLSEPLQSIRTLAQNEHDAEGVAPDAKEGFRHIISMTGKLEQWLKALASTAHSLEPLLGRHALEPILHDVVSLVQPRLAERELTTDFQCDETIPALNIDRALTEQALVAILTNAIEASPAGGQLKIHATSRDRTVEICIADQGPGLTDEAKQKALTPFFTTKRGSAGLGLTVADRIVRLHHGSLRIESDRQGGTKVCFCLPVTEPGRVKAVARQSPPA
jgi:signal transduction histidine kinase